MAERQPLDRYDSPDWFTQLLMAEVPEIAGETLLDPTCGDGSMARMLAPRFRRVVTNDINRALATDGHFDATRPALWEQTRPCWTVSNIPFNRAGLIARHALDWSRKGVALLLRLSFLEVCKGREWIAAYPPGRVLVLPRWRFVGRGSDLVTCAWLIWPQIGVTLSGPPIVNYSRRVIPGRKSRQAGRRRRLAQGG